MAPGGVRNAYSLPDLGRRIVICGPSCVGKSTLARAIGRKLNLDVVHLDQLRHLPHTDWQTRPHEDFHRLHDEAILGDAWVIEGNYFSLVPQRLERATGAIFLSDNRWANLARYFRRTLWQSDRAGHLEGSQDSLKWMMVHWIMVVSPQKTIRHREILLAAGLPMVEAHSMAELRQLYVDWDLTA